MTAARRRERLTERLAAAQDPHEQIAAAASYAVSAAKHAPPHGTDAALITEAVQTLISLGDRLLAAKPSKEDPQ
jgi:hypothetical protein